MIYNENLIDNVWVVIDGNLNEEPKNSLINFERVNEFDIKKEDLLNLGFSEHFNVYHKGRVFVDFRDGVACVSFPYHRENIQIGKFYRSKPKL